MRRIIVGTKESDETILRYSKHVEKSAYKLMQQNRNNKDLKEELIQQGYLGLLEARKRFDRSINTHGFWSYACSFVIGRMKDFMIYNMSHLRPSQKLNSISLKIYRANIANCDPDYIAEHLHCTVDTAKQGLEYMKVRNPLSLNQTLLQTEPRESLEIIDVIQSDQDHDSLFQVEVISNLSLIEQKIIKMLIDQYSARDIIRACKISNHTLNNMLKNILYNCGLDYKTILHRNGEWLMNLDQIDISDDEEKPKSELKWVDINSVLPNPNNPRRDLNTKTKHLQNLIKSYGWEEPPTCYKSGNNYIIISGHRRWNAALQMNESTIPIFIVDAPKNEAEELDRIGSVQSGQVEWSPYDQVKYTYDLWIASGKNSFENLSNELGVTKAIIGSRIRVFKYYSKSEIEDKLNNRMYSVAMLDYIQTWIRRLSNYHPALVESLGEHYIRRLMLRKYEARCFNSQIANDRTFVTSADSQDIRNFLFDINKKLEDCQLQFTYINKNQINSLEIIAAINSFQVKTSHEVKMILLEIENLLVILAQKKRTIEENGVSAYGEY